MDAVKNAFKISLNYFIVLPALLWQLFFLLFPLLIVISASIYSRDFGFSFVFYKTLFTKAHFLIIMRSLILAISNAFLCLLVAYPVAYFISFYAGKWKNLLVFLLTLPFWVNFLVHVYAWFFILQRNGLLNKFLLYLHIIKEPLYLINSMFAVWLVMFQVYLPFVVLPVYVIFEKFDFRFIEASMDLGASKRQTFWRVTFPLTLSGAKIGFFVVLGMSFGEYIVPQLMGGSKQLVVGTLISEYFIVGRSFAVGAAFTCLCAVILIAVMMLFMWGFRAVKRGKT